MADDDERAFYDGLRERIREARIAAGLTQQQLGDVMGLSRQSVNNVEMGRHNLTVLNYLRAIQALQLQVGDLLDDVPLPTITPIVQRRIRYVAPDGQTLWVTSRPNARVYAYSLPDLKLLGAVDLGGRPDWVTFTPDSRQVYISTENTNSTVVVDVAARKEITRIKVGASPKRNITVVMR